MRNVRSIQIDPDFHTEVSHDVADDPHHTFGPQKITCVPKEKTEVRANEQFMLPACVSDKQLCGDLRVKHPLREVHDGSPSPLQDELSGNRVAPIPKPKTTYCIYIQWPPT